MGLALVEMIMDVEEHFGIEIPDEDAAEIRTVGALHSYLLQRLAEKHPGGSQSVCPSGHAFYQARRTLMDQFGVPRSRIRPDSRLDDLLPRRGRREAWGRFGGAIGLHLPALSLPYEARVLATVGLSICYGFFIAWVEPRLGLSLLAAGVLGFVAWWHATKRWGTVPPTRCDTVRAVVGRMVLHQPIQPADEKLVWEMLKAIIVDQLKVAPEDVTPDATWSELGAD